MEFNKAYCLTRQSYHEREAESAKRDLEVAEMECPPIPRLIEAFRKKYEDHNRCATAWKESAEKLK